MKNYRRLSVQAVILTTLLFACNSGKGALIQAPAAGSDVASGGISQTHLWGYYDICIDPSTRTATVTPSRSLMTAFNVVVFLNQKIDNLSITVHGMTTGAGFRDVDLDVSIKHPFPTMPQFNGYDVRGIFIGNGSKQMKYNPDLKHASGASDQIVYDFGLVQPDPYPGRTGMPDGYTRWWNPTEFPVSGSLGYTQGKLASPGYFGTATLNPYKYFADGLSPQADLWSFLTATASHGVFSAGSTNTRNYYIRFPLAGPVKFGYAVVASWTSASTHPANAPEAAVVKADVTPGVYYVDDSDKGGNLIVDISVFDWDSSTAGGVMTDYKLIIESTVLKNPYQANTADMTPTAQGSGYYTYHLSIPADNVTGVEGNTFWVIVECTNKNYTNPYGVANWAGADKLAACFLHDLQVASCKFPPLNTLIDAAGQIVDAHSGVLDGVSVSFVSHVSHPTDDELDTLLDAFAAVNWGPPLSVYRINLAAIPDPLVLQQFRQQGKDYLDDFVSPCDSIYRVNWVPDPPAEPFATFAVVAPDGTVRYEPLLDTELTLTQSSGWGSKWVYDEFRNWLGFLKADAMLQISSYGADGCKATFTASFLAGYGWPYKIEPSTANPTPVKWCKPKEECTCEVIPGPDLMECATATQNYTLILYIGVDPIGAVVRADSYEMEVWLCADGTGGP